MESVGWANIVFINYTCLKPKHPLQTLQFLWKPLHESFFWGVYSPPNPIVIN